MPSKKQKALIPFIVALIANIFIGTNGVLIKIGAESMDAVLFSGLRYAAIGFALILIIKNRRLAKIFRSWKLIKGLLLNSILVLGVIIFYSIGVDESTALKASLLSLVTPVMVYLMSLFILRETFMKQPLIGGLISLAGSVLILGLPALFGQPTNIGDVYILASCVLLAISIIHAKHLYKWFTATEVVALRFGLAGIAIVTYQLSNLGLSSLTSVETSSWIALAVAITLAGFISLPLLYWSLGKLGAERSAPLLYADPLAGALLAGLFLGERLDVLALVGASVVVIGLIMTYPHHMHAFHKFRVPDKKTLSQRFRRFIAAKLHHY